MWIARKSKKSSFINKLLHLKKQVMIMRGARQVGKTSFILDAFQELKDYPQVFVDLRYPTEIQLNHFLPNQISPPGQVNPHFARNTIRYGRNFFGHSPTGDEFLQNLNSLFPKHSEKPLLVFVDEVDHYPLVMESIQTLAEVSDRIKFVFTGSNLENIQVKNVATGRKTFFDLYPITFFEFLQASQDEKMIHAYEELDFSISPTEWQHTRFQDLFEHYVRLGGLPKIVSKYLDPQSESQNLSEMITDLTVSIEENVKTVLGEKTKLYEYEDVLRKLAFLSMNTLKLTHLQVKHSSHSEAKKLVAKTVGARVAHKIRLFALEKDLSKYILFDCGMLNYLLNGSDLLGTKIPEKNLAILYESFVGNELIANLTTRDDLFYWKSQNEAEMDFALRSPYFVGIDVKSNVGHNGSLNSMALFEPDVQVLVKVGRELSFQKDYIAKLPKTEKPPRRIPLITIPHYLISRLVELVKTVLK